MNEAIVEAAFQEFAKVARLSREMIVTEKIDGTNGQVFVGEDGIVKAGSRNRWIVPEADNFGFARWAAEHADELRALGPGRHFGEWWGQGIQRSYGLTEKRFSLVNVGRWESPRNIEATNRLPNAGLSTACLTVPCCHVVPVLYRSIFDTAAVDDVLRTLVVDGSVAAPGFMKPEGVVVFHAASGQLFKKTLDKNDGHKGVRT